MIDSNLLKNVEDQDSLVNLLSTSEENGGLGWPVDTDLPFELEPEIATGVKGDGQVSVSRLIPATSGEKHLVLLAEFERPYVRRDLRELLSSVRRHTRITGRFEDHTGLGDTLFIVVAPGYEEVRFVLFEEREGRLPRIRSFGWNRENIGRTVLEYNLQRLRWSDHSTWEAAWDVESVTDAFFREYQQAFTAVEDFIRSANPVLTTQVLRLFTQRLFNRLLFIQFLSKRRWLQFEGSKDYLNALLHRSLKDGENFYHDRLYWTFFSGLGTDSREIHELPVLEERRGKLPYLNGGLFEMDNELDVRGAVQIPNEAFIRIITELFGRWNFTVMESTSLDIEVAVDPEMLGKVFEELVTGRHETGSYYTPRSVVSFMCREALKGYFGGYAELVDDRTAAHLPRAEVEALLDKLRRVRIVDPACGSGAYLLGMLHELYELTGLLEVRAEPLTVQDGYKRKLRIIQENIYGVDLEEFAVNIARLRMWLSLTVEYEGSQPEPLPNLDFKLEAGDSLLAPDPHGGRQPDMFRQQQIDDYEQLKADFANPYWKGDKRALKQEIQKLREEIAVWVHGGRALPKTTFDWRVEFTSVFSVGGFDIVLANPPYGEGNVGDALRDSLFGPKSGQSKDIYAAFMARAFHLLKTNGIMAFITSNTWRTIKTHRPVRRLLLRATVLHVTDVPEWVFNAVVRTCVFVVRNSPPSADHRMIASDLSALRVNDWATLEANLLAMAYHGPDIQTNTFARYTYPQSQISLDPNCAFFVALPSLQRFFADQTLSRLGEGIDPIGIVVVGLQTGDNEHYLRIARVGGGRYLPVDGSLVLTADELVEFSKRSVEQRLTGISPTEFGGRHFVPYDKGGVSDLAAGGWLPCYHVPTEYYIDWSTTAVSRLKTATVADTKLRKGKASQATAKDSLSLASRFQNAGHYFAIGVTFSRTGRYAPTFRRSSQSVFDTEGSCLFSDKMEVHALLAILNSTLTRFLIKAFVNNAWHAEVNDIKRLPIPRDPEREQELTDLAQAIVRQQAVELRYPYWQNEQKDIEQIVNRLYGLNGDEMRDIEFWLCRYERGRIAQARGLILETCEKYADHLARCTRILAGDPRRWRDNPILALVAKGESSTLEFKQSLEYVEAASFSKVPEAQRSQKIAENQKAVIHSALKTICAFRNSQGGTLLLGVHDKGDIIGIEPDYTLLGNKRDQDGFELKLTDLLKTRLEPIPTDLDINYITVEGKTVCRINVLASVDAHYLDNHLYIRLGNSTEELIGRQLENWLRQRP